MPGSSRNLFANSRFARRSYGLAARTTSGFVVDRVRLEAATGLSVAPDVMGASFDKKWLENATCVAMTVTASTFAGGGKVRQRIPAAGLMGRQTYRLTTISTGPVGGSYQIAFSGGSLPRVFETVTTLGDTVPLIRHLEMTANYNSSDYVTAEIFANPADLDGTYKVAFAQFDTRPPLASKRELDFFRSVSDEANLCVPYVWPCPNWLRGRGAAGQNFVVPTTTPLPMNAIPSVLAGASSVSVVQTDNSANVFTSAAPSPGFDATPNRDSQGGRVVLAGFTSPTNLVAGTEYMLTTARAFVLEAELG